MGSPEMPYWGSSVPPEVHTACRSRRAAPEVGELRNSFVHRTGHQAMTNVLIIQ